MAEYNTQRLGGIGGFETHKPPNAKVLIILTILIAFFALSGLSAQIFPQKRIVIASSTPAYGFTRQEATMCLAVINIMPKTDLDKELIANIGEVFANAPLPNSQMMAQTAAMPQSEIIRYAHACAIEANSRSKLA